MQQQLIITPLKPHTPEGIEAVAKTIMAGLINVGYDPAHLEFNIVEKKQ